MTSGAERFSYSAARFNDKGNQHGKQLMKNMNAQMNRYGSILEKQRKRAQTGAMIKIVKRNTSRKTLNQHLKKQIGNISPIRKDINTTDVSIDDPSIYGTVPTSVHKPLKSKDINRSNFPAILAKNATNASLHHYSTKAPVSIKSKGTYNSVSRFGGTQMHNRSKESLEREEKTLRSQVQS